MSAYLTDPDNPQNVRQRMVGDFDYSEALTKAWVELGIDFYYARIASIDLKHIWIPIWKTGMKPEKAANMLYGDVVSTYNLKDGKKRLQETDSSAHNGSKPTEGGLQSDGGGFEESVGERA